MNANCWKPDLYDYFLCKDNKIAGLSPLIPSPVWPDLLYFSHNYTKY